MGLRGRQVCVGEFLDYRDILAMELRNRKALSPRYSLRNFARDIGLCPSHLCGLLKKKKGLSPQRGIQVSGFLPFTGVTRSCLRFLVQLRSDRALWRRALAVQALRRGYFKDSHVELRKFRDQVPSWAQQARVIFGGKTLIRRLQLHPFQETFVRQRLQWAGVEFLKTEQFLWLL